MKNKFIAKASICMPNEDATLGILWSLERMGYRPSGVGIIGRDRNISIYMGMYQGLIFPGSSVKNINCNDFADTEKSAVELFLELAQMRSDAGTDARWLICNIPHFDDMYNKTFERGEVIDSWEYQQVDMDIFFIATPLELAQNWKQIENN